VAEYPESTLVPLARQRVAFLTARADHEFEPLARFERIRRQELARHKQSPADRERLLQQVQVIVSDFPTSVLCPEIRYWLANQYRQSNPDRAVELYRELLAKHGDQPLAADARIEIGETYYEARRYREAEAAYRDALRADPARAAAIEPQIKRSTRNQRRHTLATTGWAMLALLVVPVAAFRPRGLSRRELRRGVMALCALAPVTLLGAWLVHEQFASRLELFGLALAAPAAACLGYPVTASLGRKLVRSPEDDERRGRRWLAALAGVLLSLLAVLAASYLAIYHLNEHYLTAFGL
jgi:tetratricopeptide (TPR) repeat protein